MKQSERISKLIGVLQKGNFESQEALLKHVDCTQATLSRDLNRLGVRKVHGVYSLPEDKQMGLRIRTAGPHMLVIKTGPGGAMSLAFQIDQQNWEGLAGTLAGDDVVFVALADSG